MDFTTSLTEYTHLSEMQDKLRRRLTEFARGETVRSDSIRGAVLGLVVAEEYERARDEMEAYVHFKEAYPEFQERAARYVQHCADLIAAIQAKRHFPGLGSLSLAKQQEIHDRVVQHFEELKANLKQIEKVEREQKLTDVRSTVWVVRALCQGVLAVFLAAFILDLRSGAFMSFFKVGNYYLDEVAAWTLRLFHF